MCGIPLPPPKPPVDAVTGRRLSFDQAVAHVGGIDNLLSEHGKQLIRTNARQYLWKYPNKTTWCTACGKPIEGFTGRHGALYACPRCGARAEFRYEAKGHQRVYDEFVLYEWRRSVLDAETITLTATWARRDSTRGHQPHLEQIQTSPSAIYVFRPGKAVTVYKKDSYWGRYNVDTPWQRVDAIHPEHTKAGTYNGADIVIDRDQFRAALEGTRIGRVFDSLREASGRWDDLELMAIANCARRPWLEYLAKCGQERLAAALMREPHTLYNWRWANKGKSMADAIAHFRAYQTGERQRYGYRGGGARPVAYRVGGHVYTVGGVAKKYGVTPQSVRHYMEKHGGDMAATLKHYREREKEKQRLAEAAIMKALGF